RAHWRSRLCPYTTLFRSVNPEEIVDRYHPEFLGYWDTLGISFDLFTTTGTDNHIRVAQEFFLKLLENGHLYPKVTDQFYDEERGDRKSTRLNSSHVKISY